MPPFSKKDSPATRAPLFDLTSLMFLHRAHLQNINHCKGNINNNNQRDKKLENMETTNLVEKQSPSVLRQCIRMQSNSQWILGQDPTKYVVLLWRRNILYQRPEIKEYKSLCSLKMGHWWHWHGSSCTIVVNDGGYDLWKERVPKSLLIDDGSLMLPQWP